MHISRGNVRVDATVVCENPLPRSGYWCQWYRYDLVEDERPKQPRISLATSSRASRILYGTDRHEP